MTNEECFAQGARCGHIEGQGRAGSYVMEEEVELSWQAAENQSLNKPQTMHWAHGYQYGYRLAAEGAPLDDNLKG